MLNYKIRLDSSAIQQKPISVLSAYIAHDLSFISGVTYASEHLETLSSITVSSNYSNGIQQCDITTENHQRQGYITVHNQVLEVKDTSDLHVDGEYGSQKGVLKYVEFNNKYYYVYEDDGVEKILFDDIVGEDGHLSSSTCTVVENTDVPSNSSVSLTYSVWVDDSMTTINGVQYYVEPNYTDDSGHTFCLTTEEGGTPIVDDNLTLTLFDAKKRFDVTYFTITVNTEILYPYNTLSCGNNILIVTYHDNIRKIVNIGTSDMPIYGVKNVTNDDENPVSGMCYAEDYDGGISAIMGDDYKNIIDYNFGSNIESIWFQVDGDDTQYPISTELQSSNAGPFIIVTTSPSYVVGTGCRFTFRSTETDIHKDILTDYEGKEYVLYNGRKYLVQSDLCCQVIINDEYFDATPVYGENAYSVDIYGTNVIMYVVDDDTVENRNNTVVKETTITDEEGVEKTILTSQYQQYQLIHRDGVCIDDTNCPVIENENEIESGNNVTAYVELNMGDAIAFVVDNNYGSNVMLMSPYLDKLDFALDDILSIQRDICASLYEGQSYYGMFGINRIFGPEPIRIGTGYLNRLEPSNSETEFSVQRNVEIIGHNGNVILSIPFSIKSGGSPLIDNAQESDFYQTTVDEQINRIVDMERDVYYPEYFDTDSDGNITYESGYPKTYPIYEIDFNFHFRTRDLDNWKVVDSDTAKCYGIDNNNWFITDYYPYKDKITTNGDELEELSDLLGLLYFTNGDVFYQKKKLEKTFVQLSFYDSPDPQTQSLLYTSTIFFDENYSYKKYITNRKRLDSLRFRLIDEAESATTTQYNSISVLSEPYEQNSGYTFDNSSRLSSRFVVKNKYETDTSSDGFYLYIFREYSKGLHLVPIYMKVEFKHAGLGQTIPMIIPMDWTVDDDKCASPNRKLHLKNDLEKIKSGYTLSDIYMQTYIPLYVTFDKNTNKYCYAFDSRYVSTDNGIAKLNMFELKVADEDKQGYNAETFDLVDKKWVNDENS